MSTYYLLPGNWNIGPVQTIPVDPFNKIHQSESGVNAAEKVQNLNTVLMDVTNETTISANIKTTVAQVRATDPDDSTKEVPAYLIHVVGWTNGAVADFGELQLLGGFPRCFNKDQNVDPAKASYVLPQGTLTVFETPLLGTPITPQVYMLGDTEVVLSDVSTTPSASIPNWAITLDSPYIQTDSILEFDLSFYLFVQ